MTGEQLDLDAIKARCEAATQGPWEATHSGDKEPPRIWVSDELIAKVCASKPYSDWIPDAEFIAHARQDVPALVAEVERLRARLDAVLAAVDQHPDPCSVYLDGDPITCGWKTAFTDVVRAARGEQS